jgi:hypothetical protein
LPSFTQSQLPALWWPRFHTAFVCFQLPHFITGTFLIGLLKLRGRCNLLGHLSPAVPDKEVPFGGRPIIGDIIGIQIQKKMFIHPTQKVFSGATLFGS